MTASTGGRTPCYPLKAANCRAWPAVLTPWTFSALLDRLPPQLPTLTSRRRRRLPPQLQERWAFEPVLCDKASNMSVSTATRRPPMHHNHNLLHGPNTSARRHSHAHNDHLPRSTLPDSSKSIASNLSQVQNGHSFSSNSTGTLNDSFSEAPLVHGGLIGMSTHNEARNATNGAKRARGPPDWEAFYKNGIPKEVIVIEDTPEAEEAHPNGSTNGEAAGESSNGVNGIGRTRNGQKQTQPPGTVRPSDLSRNSRKRSLDQAPEDPEPTTKRKRTASTIAEEPQASQRKKRTKTQPSEAEIVHNSLNLWRYPEYKGVTGTVQRTRKDVHLRAGTVVSIDHAHLKF